MFGAIGPALERGLAAKMEVFLNWITNWPQTGWPLHQHDLRGFALDRRLTRRQAHAVDLAHNRVFRDAEPAPDLAGGQSLIPQALDFCDPFGGSAHGGDPLSKSCDIYFLNHNI